MSEWIIMHSEDALCHYGRVGMKWGQHIFTESDEHFGKRKAKYAKKINTMYDRANKWNSRKVRILERKGKTAKANIWKYAIDENEKGRKQKLDYLNSADKASLKKSRNRERLDYWFGGMQNNPRNVNTDTLFRSRWFEYNFQRGMRWSSNFTTQSKLLTMTVEQGYQYLENKRRAANNYWSGYNAGGSKSPQYVYIQQSDDDMSAVSFSDIKISDIDYISYNGI